MGILSWLIPQEKHFFDMIEQQSKNVLLGVDALVNLLEHYNEIDKKRERIKQIENEGDKMVHDIFSELNKTFITPIDREDITKLTSSLDDILDNLEAVSERLIIYEIKKPPKYMLEFAQILQKTTRQINEGISLLRNLKEAKQIRDVTVEKSTPWKTKEISFYGRQPLNCLRKKTRLRLSKQKSCMMIWRLPLTDARMSLM